MTGVSGWTGLRQIGLVQLSSIPFRPVTPKIGHPFALASQAVCEQIHRAVRLMICQAIFRRRRHQPRRPPPANSRPGSPAPAIGPGTASEGAEETEKLSIWEIPPLAKAENPLFALTCARAQL